MPSSDGGISCGPMITSSGRMVRSSLRIVCFDTIGDRLRVIEFRALARPSVPSSRRRRRVIADGPRAVPPGTACARILDGRSRIGRAGDRNHGVLNRLPMVSTPRSPRRRTPPRALLAFESTLPVRWSRNKQPPVIGIQPVQRQIHGPELDRSSRSRAMTGRIRCSPRCCRSERGPVRPSCHRPSERRIASRAR